MSDNQELQISQILKLVQQEGRAWTAIGKLLGEHPEKIRGKFRRWEEREEEAEVSYRDVEDGQVDDENDEDDVDVGSDYAKPEIKINEGVNEKTISSKSNVIRSFDDLIVACDIDTSVWELADTPKLTTWTTTLNIDNVPVQKTNYYVSVRLRRTHPIATIPIVRPITISSPVQRARVSRPLRDRKVALIGSDAQFGFSIDNNGNSTRFHDARALDIFLQVADSVQPDEIILNGDWLDLAGFSRWPESPLHARTTQVSLIELGWYLWQLRRLCPGANIHYLSGNHEDRMHKAVMQNLRAAYELRSIDALNGYPVLSVPHLLALDKIGVQYYPNYPDDKLWLNDLMYVEHGFKALSRSGKTASAVVNDSVYSVIFGHAHRREYAERRIFDRHGDYTIVAACSGCLCHIDGRVPAQKKEVNWQQSFHVVYYSENVKIEPEILITRINDGKASFLGGLYKGDENLFADNLDEQTMRYFTQND